jgi:hypothetical protein
VGGGAGGDRFDGAGVGGCFGDCVGELTG